MKRGYSKYLGVFIVVVALIVVGLVMRTPMKLPARHVTSRGIDLLSRRMLGDIKASMVAANLELALPRLIEKYHGEKDGWGQPYLFRIAEGNVSVIITSMGQDGRRDTSDDLVRTIDLRELQK